MEVFINTQKSKNNWQGTVNLLRRGVAMLRLTAVQRYWVRVPLVRESQKKMKVQFKS
jgi:hypothetical protein